jgi:hypothetical protein
MLKTKVLLCASIISVFTDINEIIKYEEYCDFPQNIVLNNKIHLDTEHLHFEKYENLINDNNKSIASDSSSNNYLTILNKKK